MEVRFKAGHFLFYQLEAGFALIRLLGITIANGELIWHLSAFQDLFPDVESIERSISRRDFLTESIEHVALTNRAFESTQVAEIGFSPLTVAEKNRIEAWNSDPDQKVSDLSIRLHTGLR